MSDWTTVVNDNSSNWTTTVNDSSSYVSPVPEQMINSMKVASIVLYSIIFVLGIPVNAIFMCTQCCWNNKAHMFSVAFVDMLCCLTIPLSVIMLVGHWPYGAAMCTFHNTTVKFAMFAGGFNLTMRSYVRFTMVCHPLRRISIQWLYCGLVWLMALLLSLPDLIYIETVEVYKTCCVYDINQFGIRAIQVTRFVFGFLVPLLVMIRSSVCILHTIYMMNPIRRPNLRRSNFILVGELMCFLITWMPYHTLTLVMMYGEGRSVHVAVTVLPLATSLLWLQFCLNSVSIMLYRNVNIWEEVRRGHERFKSNVLGGPERLMSNVREGKRRFKKGQLNVCISLRLIYEKAFTEEIPRGAEEELHGPCLDTIFGVCGDVV